MISAGCSYCSKLCAHYIHLDFIFLSLSIFHKKMFFRHVMGMTAATARAKTIMLTLRDLRNYYQTRLFHIKFRSNILEAVLTFTEIFCIISTTEYILFHLLVHIHPHTTSTFLKYLFYVILDYIDTHFSDNFI